MIHWILSIDDGVVDTITDSIYAQIASNKWIGHIAIKCLCDQIWRLPVEQVSSSMTSFWKKVLTVVMKQTNKTKINILLTIAGVSPGSKVYRKNKNNNRGMLFGKTRGKPTWTWRGLYFMISKIRFLGARYNIHDKHSIIHQNRLKRAYIKNVN